MYLQRYDAKNIFLSGNNSGYDYKNIKDGFYGKRNDGVTLVWLKENYELDFIEYEASRHPQQRQDVRYLRLYGRLSYSKRDPVNEPNSDYGLFMNENYEAQGITRHKLEIIDLRTREIIASTIYFTHEEQYRFCGHAPDGSFSQAAFIGRSLNLKPKSR